MRPALLIMAAGMGTRYGGLKQMDSVGPSGETIMDYSIYDALRAGFSKIVFVIRPDFEDVFREKIGSRFQDKVEVVYVHQTLDACTEGYVYPAERAKPWGTGHAILVAKDAINEPFAVINADDFYGARSFAAMGEYLASLDPKTTGQYSMVGFELKKTLSEHGHVARGLCEESDDGLLKSVVEHTQIEKTPDGAKNTFEDGSVRVFSGDEIVSMNLWGFQPDVFDRQQRLFSAFLKERGQELKGEFFIPKVIDDGIARGEVSVHVLHTSERWFGVTYRNDKEFVMASIRTMVDDGLYPEELWSK